MVSVLDSEAHFERKAREAGITDPNVAVLKNRGFKTLSQVAYMVSQPGVPMPESDFATFCSAHFASFSIGEISSLRRLIFESQTLTVASLRLQVSDPDASSKQKMPEAERDVRLENLKRSLPGITIEGHLEPARSLLDAAARIEASNQIVYLAPEKCVSRLYEVAQAKPVTKQVDIEASKLVIKEASDPVEAPTHGAMAVFDAFRRRGLALCFANLIHWPNNERYLNTLFKPPAPRSKTRIFKVHNSPTGRSRPAVLVTAHRAKCKAATQPWRFSASRLQTASHFGKLRCQLRVDALTSATA